MKPVEYNSDTGVVKLANGKLYRTIAWEEYIPAYREHLEEKQISDMIPAASDTATERASPGSDGDNNA